VKQLRGINQLAYHFNLPVITDLTITQQAVLNETGAIAVSGGPGTGKSVVSLWRHIQNYDMGRRKSLLLTYSKSLETYLISSAKSNNINAGNAVSRTFWWLTHQATNAYEEIIIDEAQDVEISKYHAIRQYSDLVSFSIDPDQSMYLSPAELAELTRGLPQLFPRARNYPLDDNFRNTNEIVQLTRSLFPDKLITDGVDSGPLPTLVCTDNDGEKQIQSVIDVINQFRSDTHNIAILVPLRDNVTTWHRILEQRGVSSVSKYIGTNMEVGTIENVHVTTFKSSKGLEFDTVIIPHFNNFEQNMQTLRTVSDKDYYVALTRARRNLVLVDNSYTNSNNRCSLNFMIVPINSQIINVDYDYITNRPIQQAPTSNPFGGEDDEPLPF
jgi:superfamily I DNA/RNA helicase